MNVLGCYIDWLSKLECLQIHTLHTILTFVLLYLEQWPKQYQVFKDCVVKK
jgi:hypothetical protein